jgi:hypothetical protein
MRTPRDSTGAFGRRAAPDPGRGRRVGVAAAVTLAALVSAGLVYWIGAGQDRGPPSAAETGGPSSPTHAAFAPPRPDAGQVARAYEQLQEIYADQGGQAVMDFGRACAGSLRGDPGMLDFCLAFDTYAASLESEDEAVRAWQAQSGARDLALAQSALPPGADAAGRLAQVSALARQADIDGVAPERQRSPAAPAVGGQAHAAGAPAAGRTAKAEMRKTAQACRLRATAAQRMICASPALEGADSRLRMTYRRALAAGVSPSRLAQDQALFRSAVNAAGADETAVARLYHRRTRALEEQIRALPPA